MDKSLKGFPEKESQRGGDGDEEENRGRARSKRSRIALISDCGWKDGNGEYFTGIDRWDTLFPYPQIADL